ncbi:MAG TPA: hypothetical protein DCQ06_11915 [Myxococcales bacterium]|nr:hypothetical protein [Myxococcales bacterium]HAN32294.1 hypothetical protein [Myxococcales bacterium]
MVAQKAHLGLALNAATLAFALGLVNPAVAANSIEHTTTKSTSMTADAKHWLDFATATVKKSQGRKIATPNWLRHWRDGLRRRLAQAPQASSSWSHPLAERKLQLLRLGETAATQQLNWTVLSCPNQEIAIEVLWRNSQGQHLLGVQMRCRLPNKQNRWIRAGIWTNSQGEVRRAVALQVVSPSESWPVQLSTLAAGYRPQVTLQGGDLLSQVTIAHNLKKPMTPGTFLPRPKMYRPVTNTKDSSRCVVLTRYNGTRNQALYCGQITALQRERTAAALRSPFETSVAPAQSLSVPPLAQLGLRQFSIAGVTFWLQATGRRSRLGPVDAGVACWISGAKGWQRVALPLPRTHNSGQWYCTGVLSRLYCDFATIGHIGKTQLRSRQFKWDKGQWHVQR